MTAKLLTIIPVSYTHLGVYKRQVVDNLIETITVTGGKAEGYVHGDELSLQNMVITVTSVSYTHLLLKQNMEKTYPSNITNANNGGGSA